MAWTLGTKLQAVRLSRWFPYLNLRERIEENIKDSGLERHFTLLGFRSDVAQILPLFDAFCMPSLYEGFCGALLEAQCAGLPCLATDSLPEEIFGENCTPFSLNDPTAWSEELNRIAAAKLSKRRDQILIKKYANPDLARRLTHFYQQQSPTLQRG